jgi:hypothetical protein
MLELKQVVEHPVMVVVFRFIVVLLLVLIASGATESFSGQPFDYGIGQRRDVLLSHTGSDQRSLAAKIDDAITEHGAKEVAVAVKEGLVASTNGAPAFWEGARYNLEGTMKGGAINPQRSNEAFREGMNDSDMLERFDDHDLLESFDDADLLKQNFQGGKW